MPDLITAAYAKRRINQDSFTSGEDDTIDELITAVSKAIQRYCRRQFDAQTFDQLHDGTNSSVLALREFPILSVARVAYGPTTVLNVTNTSAANQRATVAVTSTGLALVRVASGVITTDAPTFAANVTLAALATAVNALGNGWSASVVPGHEDRASADLRATQGAFDAKNIHAALRMHINELSQYEVNAERGWLIRGYSDPDFEDQGAVWHGGWHYYRIIYTAGFATVPEDVQEAAAEWVAALFWQTKDNPASYPELPPTHAALLLNPYRKLRI